MVFVQKSNFFHLDFFGVINLDKNAFFFLYSWQTRMILDQKVNVLKGAKNRHFPKGITMVFVQKSNFFSPAFFGVINSEKNLFYIFLIEKNDFRQEN